MRRVSKLIKIKTMSTQSIINQSKNLAHAASLLKGFKPAAIPTPRTMGVEVPTIRINWIGATQSLWILTMIYISDVRGINAAFLFFSLYGSAECIKAMIKIKNQPTSKTINQGLDQVPDRYSTQVENARAVLRSLERKSGVEIL